MLRAFIWGAFMDREPMDDCGFIGRELMEPGPTPRLPKFPVEACGRGTDREPMDPFCGPRALLNAGPRLLAPTELLNPPRLAPIAGRCCAPPNVGRCATAVWPGLDALPGPAFREFALNEPRLAVLAPARAPAFSEPRLLAETAVRLTTGRAKARCGGTAARTPREPMMLARVGATPGE